MARDPIKRRISRQLQNERRKAQRRLKSFGTLKKAATKLGFDYSSNMKQREINELLEAISSNEDVLDSLSQMERASFDVATSTTRNKSVEESRKTIYHARDVTTRHEMQQLMGDKRVTSKRRGSTLEGMSKSELQVFFAVTSDYARGVSRKDKMQAIREGINRDFGVNLQTDAEVIDFVRKSEAYKETLAHVPGIGQLTSTDELGHYYLEGEFKYMVYSMLSSFAHKYRQVHSVYRVSQEV